jgi:iron complex transport system ATP-binding protein
MSRADLRIERLHVAYGRHPALAVDSPTAIRAGEIVALVGPNAAGTSSFLKALAGLVRSSGRALLGSDDLVRLRAAERARLVGYLPQDYGGAAALTVFEAVLLAVMSLAQALARSPRLLLLDEPTSALDLRHQLELLELVRGLARQRQAIVIAALHDLGLAARFADRLIVLDRGRLRACAPAEQALTVTCLREVWGIDAWVGRGHSGLLEVTAVRSLRQTSERHLPANLPEPLAS